MNDHTKQDRPSLVEPSHGMPSKCELDREERRWFFGIFIVIPLVYVVVVWGMLHL